MSYYHYVYSGETSSGIELNNDGRMEIFSGGTAIDTTVNSHCQVNVYSGGTASRTTLNSSWMTVYNGASADSVAVNAGGWLDVYGTATNVEWSPFCGGIVDVEFGAQVTFANQMTGVFYGSKNELLEHADVIKDKSLYGWYNDIYVMSGGTAVNTRVGSAATLKVYDGGIASSATVTSNGSAYVYSGGSVDSVTINAITVFEVFAGGTATNIDVSSKTRFSFAVAPGTYITGKIGSNSIEMKDGVLSSSTIPGRFRIQISSGGTADAVSLDCYDFSDDYTEMYVSNGGVAKNTSLIRDAYIIVYSGGVADSTSVDDGAKILVSNCGVADHTVIHSRGSLTVCGGGEADHTTVEEADGRVWVSSGGVMKNTTVKSGGSIILSSGGTHAGRMRTEEGAIVSAYAGAVIDFSLADAAPDVDPLLDDWSRIKGKENALYTLTVNAGQSAGKYALAAGADSFSKSISVRSTSGESLGTLWLGDDPKKIRRRLYSVGVTDGALTLTVDAIAPENCPDNGWNDYVYDKKREKKNPPEPALNPYRYDLVTTTLSAETKEILLDREDTIDKDGKYNFVGKADGVEDAADFARIELYYGANLSFDVESTAGGKFAIYQFVTGTDKKGKTTYSMKSLQSTSLKKAKDATEFTAQSKLKLLEAGTYYVAMQGAIAKKGDTEGYYNVLLNSSTRYYADGDGGWNNWLYDKKTKNPNSERYYFMSTTIGSGASDVVLDSGVSHTDETGTWKNFVGFGDDTDFGRIRLNHAASLSFSVKATDAAKFTVWRLDTGTDKKGNVTYTQKSLQATTLKKAKGETLFTAGTKSLLLEKGEYYISVQSTNAKKGDSAYYDVKVNQAECKYFADGDSGWNNYLYDKKNTDAPLNTGVYEGSAQTIGSGTGSVQLDDGSYTDESGTVWRNFVGFGDAADFRKISLDSDTALSFTLTATDAAKFTIWRLDEGTDRKGATTYTQKSLQATTLKQAKGETLFTAETKLLSLDAGVYYVSMESTNSAKGGCAYYDVAVNGNSTFAEAPAPAAALPMPEKVLSESATGFLASL